LGDATVRIERQDMSIITISSSSGKIREEIGEKAAMILEYQLLGQEMLVAAASEEYGIRSEHLAQAFNDSPSPRRISSGKRRQRLACLQAQLAHYFLADNIVYTGPIGHLLIHGISHIFKVYIAESIEDRTRRLMDEEQISEKKAEKILVRREKDHKRWVKEAFGTDDDDPSSFDLMIKLDTVDVEKACELVVEKVGAKKYQAMTYSCSQMIDRELAYRVRANLVDLNPDITVQSTNGEVTVTTKAHGKAREKSLKIIQDRITAIDGVRELKVHVREDLFRQMEEGMR